ncbi:nucleotidyltransferase [Taibaiella sp. KBW10]|uniref:Y-family DNA polymerase n=1 Tax=Taibaiella sp. KBW10 TaxID=2153357 RepID=UPI000F59E745|nr:DNA polymerase Y family protein [Taibaiella sp. KBW10]RQO31956.1 nucleotidyltransferase [Taibaiella sp. KBW10]
MSRYLAIWFPYLVPDRLARRKPALRKQSFVTSLPERGRLVIQSASAQAVLSGIKPGMILADARAIYPDLITIDHDPKLPERLLTILAEWCLRFTPIAATDLPDGLILDISGCTHLWGGESSYLKEIIKRLSKGGYHVHAAIADTVGAAWALSRYEQNGTIIEKDKQKDALICLPVSALRLPVNISDRLYQLGLTTIGGLLAIPRQGLKKRFGQELLTRIDQALGMLSEPIKPVCPAPVFQERLYCLEPVCTAKAITIGLQQLLASLCSRLVKEKKGLRKAVLTCYRIDNKVQQIEIGTHRAARDTAHLFRLFENKIANIAPGLGIELFVLDAPVTDPLDVQQESLWMDAGMEQNRAITQLLDRIGGRLGPNAIQRYLPAEHHWPERSYMPAATLSERPAIPWPKGLSRPVYVLPRPEPIKVSVPIPDYPPMLFIYNGVVHNIKKADGPERIEREWWIDKGLQRDYYCVEDTTGKRYWLFRSGHYDSAHAPDWFIHGFFA